MQSLLRKLIVGFVLASFAAFTTAASAQTKAPAKTKEAKGTKGTKEDPAIGSWTLDVAKSKFSGPAPRSVTETVELFGKGIKVTTETVAANGARSATEYTAMYDGKEYPIVGSRDASTVSLKQVNAQTSERTDKKYGIVMQTVTRVVSKDGKIMTETVKSRGGYGQILVFDKQ